MNYTNLLKLCAHKLNQTGRTHVVCLRDGFMSVQPRALAIAANYTII